MLRDTDGERDALLLGSAEAVGTYVVSYGAAGYFERCLASNGEPFERGERVLIKSRRGVEAGLILCPATRGLDEFFHDQPAGELLRRVTTADDSTLAELHDASLCAFDRARELCGQLEFPIEIVDVESLLEPRTFLFHHLGGVGDYRELVSRLSKEFDVYVELISLSGTLPGAEQEAEVCAECGSTEGGCNTSSSGGGCGTESGCGTAKKQMTPDEWRAYFASLRERMNGQAEAE